jgi:hypothetical protein
MQHSRDTRNAHRSLVGKLVEHRPLARPAFRRAPCGGGGGSTERGDKLSGFIKAGLPELLLASQKRLSSMGCYYYGTTEELWFDSRQWQETFLFPTRSRLAPVFIQSPIQWVQRAIYQGVKQPEREADHTSLSSVKVKNVWSYTSTPLSVFMVLFLIKHRKSLFFYL